jgi:lipid-binding SYLF domain-containing protein
MKRYFRLMTILFVSAFVVVTIIRANGAEAATADQISRDSKASLKKLYAKSPVAKTLSEKAKGILVFPAIYKAGLMVGGQYGDGALLKGGEVVGYYNTVQLSYGLQAGAQKYGYVLFFMSDSAFKWLDKSDGWEVGVGPTITVVDVGAAKSLTTTTMQSDVYAIFFDQKGLMAGLGLQGTKITKINK